MTKLKTLESQLLIKWGKDSNIMLEYISGEYYLYVVYPIEKRFEQYISTRKLEIKTILSQLRDKGLNIPKWD